MIRIAKAMCWLCVGLIVLGIGGMLRANANVVRASHFVPLLPFAMALVAYYSEPKAMLVWAAFALNALMAIAGVLLLLLPLFSTAAVPAAGVVVGAAFLALALLNLAALQLCRRALKRSLQ